MNGIELMQRLKRTQVGVQLDKADHPTNDAGEVLDTLVARAIERRAMNIPPASDRQQWKRESDYLKGRRDELAHVLLVVRNMVAENVSGSGHLSEAVQEP